MIITIVRVTTGVLLLGLNRHACVKLSLVCRARTKVVLVKVVS